MKEVISKRTRLGFTLIEVLVVVAIIGLLLAVLVPSLARAREQGRIVKCLANMSNMGQAVLLFAQQHKGYGQAVARGYDDFESLPEGPEWLGADPQHNRYAYQSGLSMGDFSTDEPFLKAWPVAYASELGVPSIKRMEQYLAAENVPDPSFYDERFGRHEIFTCPSDKDLVRDMWSPGTMYGLLSYAINEDVFGVSKGAWKEGLPHNTGAPRLRGRLELIRRPSEVALFCDGGREWDFANNANVYKKGRRVMLVTWGDFHGPYLENYEWMATRLPHSRHSEGGGLCVAFADGSGRYVKPAGWVTNPRDGERYVTRYIPRVRVSPYDVGRISQFQP